jgi:hypothetical protein
VAEVGVHVDGHVESMLPPQLETFQDRRPQPAPAASHQQMQPRVVFRQRQRDLPGPVGGVVVDDQQLQVGSHRQLAVDQRGDVLALVVGGRHDEDPARWPVAS